MMGEALKWWSLTSVVSWKLLIDDKCLQGFLVSRCYLGKCMGAWTPKNSQRGSQPNIWRHASKTKGPLKFYFINILSDSYRQYFHTRC